MVLSNGQQSNYTLNPAANTNLATNTTNTITLAKAPLGISDTTATYVGSTTITSSNGAIVLTGLVGSDIGATALSGIIDNANVGSASKFNSVALSNGSEGNYRLNPVANANLATNTTNTIILTAAPLGITLSATYNGTSAYGTSANITQLSTSNSGITVAGLLQSDYLSGITINSPNVSANSSNYVTAISGSSNLSTNYSLPAVNYAATGGTFTGAQTPIAGTTNAVILAKAPLGINLNAVYNGTTTYTAVIKTNGLVGSDVAPGVSSVTITSKDVSTVGNYITGVTGNVGVNDTNMLNNYIISSSASGTPTSGNPGSTTTNTVTLTKAPLGINLNAVYNGTTSYSQGTQADFPLPTIQTNGLVGTDTVTKVVINNPNVSANQTNFIQSVIGNNGIDLLQNYTISNTVFGTPTAVAPITNQNNNVTLIPASLGISVKGTYNGTNVFNNTNSTIIISGLVGPDSIGSVSVTVSNSIANAEGNYVTSVKSNAFDSSNYVINGKYQPAVTNGICISNVCSGLPSRIKSKIDSTNVVSIIQVSTVGLPTIDIVNNRQGSVTEGSSGGSKADTSMIVAHGLIPGQPDELFPSQTYFIGNTRYLPYDGKDKMSLGVKIGTAYDNINPIDYVVVPDIYEMKNLINNKTN